MKRISALGLLFVFLGLTVNPANALMIHCNRYFSPTNLQSCVSELTREVEDLKDEIAKLRSELRMLQWR